MPKVPRINGSKAVKAFEKAGFEVVRISGSHHIMAKDDCENRLSIPVHANKNVGVGLLADQIKVAGLTVAEFIELI